MHAIQQARAALLAIAAVLPCVARADEPAPPHELQRTASAAAPTRDFHAFDNHAFDYGALDHAALDRMRGGTDTLTNITNDMRLQGTVSDAVASDIASGGNTVAGGAFTNANGIPTIFQNTGSNVLIQNALIVNLQFK